MTKRALIVQHDHVSPPGFVGERLSDRGYDLILKSVVPAPRFHDPGVEADFPDFEGFDVVVALGAPWSTYDELVASWARPELEQLRRADRAGVPVLGICFGGQMIATAHGGSVHASPSPEIGWTEVVSDDDALVPGGPWFQWHYDRWSVPPGAIEVARNPVASQAFVLRRNLAVQFHPELTLDTLRGWLDHGGSAKAEAAGISGDLLLGATRDLEQEARERAWRLVDAFLDVVATSAIAA